MWIRFNFGQSIYFFVIDFFKRCAERAIGSYWRDGATRDIAFAIREADLREFFG